MKRVIKKIFGLFGYKIITSKVESDIANIGSDNRPVGSMKSLLEDLRERGLICKTFVDIGANNTMYSRMVKEVFPEADFCLIEPQIEMKNYLEEFCKDFKNSVYFLAGAGAKSDKMVLTIWDDLSGSSFLLDPDEELKNIGKQREVEIVTLDNLINDARIKLPELVKLDVQGFELEALKGAEKTFGYTEVYILEVSLFASDSPGMPIFSDVINFMLQRNYVVYDFPGFLRRPSDGALAQCDICFVKSDGMFRKSNNWN